MKKIVLKVALMTVGALAAAGILVFSLWILISPQSMATVSEKLGNYNFAVTCANLKYKYSGDSYDLARCAEDGILADNDKLIVEYCEQLIEKSDFSVVCRRRYEDLARTDVGYVTIKMDYSTYILGNLATAQYRTGDLEQAVKTAELGEVGCFRKLVLEIISNGSTEDLEKVQTLPTSLEASEYVKWLINLPK